MTGKQIVEKAKSFLGEQGAPTWKRYDGRDYNAGPWCACFVWAVFNECGAANLLGVKSSYVEPLLGYAQKNDERITDLTQVKEGDLVWFDWNPSAGDGVDHIGIVTGPVSATQITTIEGNTSPGVGYLNTHVSAKTRSKGDITHIYRPKYEEEKPTPSPTPTPTPTPVDLKIWDRVRVKDGAKDIEGNDFLDWVYETDMFVREIKDHNITISNKRRGDIVGITDYDNLILVSHEQFKVGQDVWFTGGEVCSNVTSQVYRTKSECYAKLEGIYDGTYEYLIRGVDIYGFVLSSQLLEKKPEEEKKEPTPEPAPAPIPEPTPVPEPSNILKVGDKVEIIAQGWSNALGTKQGWIADGIGYIREVMAIFDEATYSVQVGAGGVTTGFYKPEALKKL